jgi:deoxycytidylate deaminase
MANPHPVTKGRKRGVPNKFSIARVERAIAEGRKMPPDELLCNAEKCRAMVVHFAPMRVNADTGQMEVNPDHNLKDYRDWLADERDALKAAAPYYAPRLMAMAVQTATLDRDKEARAKHIVAAGIARVVFLEPYPKSLASDLHSDSIEVERGDRGHYEHFPSVKFEHFYGVSHRRYREIFERTSRKNQSDGSFHQYIDGADGTPLMDIRYPFYNILEKHFTKQALVELLTVVDESELANV